jgi:hypothetical protein
MWGSVPGWISVAIAFAALFLFLIVERDRLVLKQAKEKANDSDQASASNSKRKEGAAASLRTNLRAALYSRILIGVILGIALIPIYSVAFSGLYTSDSAHDYSAIRDTMTLVNLLAGISLSTIVSFVYLRTHDSWSGMFVSWVERFAIAFVCMLVISIDFGVREDPDSARYVTYAYDPYFIMVVSSIMFTLIKDRTVHHPGPENGAEPGMKVK